MNKQTTLTECTSDRAEIILVSPDDLATLEAVAVIDREAFGADGVTAPNLALFARAGAVFALRQDHSIAAQAIVLGGIDRSTGFLFSLAVAASHRRLGCGRQLMMAMCDYLEKKNFKHLELTVDPKNAPAMNLYIDHFGFAKAAFLKDHFGPGKDRWLLRKDFSSRATA